jgi:hypothetical protein
MSICINNSITNCANFKGSVKNNENGVPYYNSTCGTIIGGVNAAILGGSELKKLRYRKLDIKTPEDKELAERVIKNMYGKNTTIEDVQKFVEKNKKMAIPSAIIYAAAALGCGMLVDHIRNNNAKKAASQIASMSPREALERIPNVEVSKHRQLYYNSNTGSKYGFMLGLGFGALPIIRHLAIGGKLNPKFSILALAQYGICGWLSGLLTDHNTNKNADLQSIKSY